jgi:hypothetical protein
MWYPMTDKKISVYSDARLEEQIARLQDKLGIKTDSALIRYCVNEVYKKHFPEAIVPVQPASYAPVSH